MNDFYSLLRQSVIDRDLRSLAQREEAYEQARRALIRRLWAYDPPLADAAIDASIQEFDEAAARIEEEARDLFADRDLSSGEAEPSTAVAVYDSRDRQVARGPASLGAMTLRGTAVEQVWDSDGDDWPGDSGRQVAIVSAEAKRRAIEAALRGEADAAFRAGAPVDQTSGWDEPDAPDDVSERRRREDRERALPDDEPPSRWRQFNFDAPAVAMERLRDLRRSTRVGILAASVGVLAVLFLAVTAYVLLHRGSPAPGDQIASDQPVRREVLGPESAAKIPTEIMKVERSFGVFDGSDPTVFVADSDNPVDFDGRVDNGTARIATTSDSSGARIVIGPGIANSLSGRSVRVVLFARSARENGATTLRFAYQSGVAISHWQVANLTPTYAPLGLVWRVPAQRTDPSGDYLIIEPGIPGDGTRYRNPRRPRRSSRRAGRRQLGVAEIAVAAQPLDQAVGERGRVGGGGIQPDVRLERRLVGRVDAGEMLDLARPRLLVEALRVALLDDVERRVDEDLEELAGADQLARHPPLRAERRDEGDEHDQPGVDEELRRLGDAADVLDAVGVGEAEVAVEAVADVVAVEQVGVAAHQVELLLDEVGDGRLAGAGEAGEPQDARLLALERRRGPACSTSSACQWMLVARRRPKRIMPAATVALVKRSMRMNEPVVRLSS